MRAVFGVLLYLSLAAAAGAQGTPNLFQQLLRPPQGQAGYNTQLVAHLKQSPDLEFLVANKGTNFFLVRKSVAKTAEVSKAVVVGIYPNPAVRGGQAYVGSAIELQIRCETNDYRAVNETALNAQLRPVAGVIAAKPAGDFTTVAPSGVAHEVALRLCGGSTVSPDAPAQQLATTQQPGQPARRTRGVGLFGDVPLDVEIAIGRQLAGDLLGAVPLVKNENLQAYVNNVGRWVAAHSERADLKWYFGVLETQDINAFALPGGYIFVTEGLVRMLGSEAELAGVLAHEIAHVLMKHHIKLLQQSKLVSAFADLATQRVARDQSLRGAAIRNLLGNGAQILARGLDRNAEFEADRMGVVLATRAGYDPYALPTVLQLLDRRNPADGAVALLFKTHPHAHERLIALGDAMEASFDQYAHGKELRDRFASAAPWPVRVAAATVAPAPAPQAQPFAAAPAHREPEPIAREQDDSAEQGTPPPAPAPAQSAQADAQKAKESPTLASSLKQIGQGIQGVFTSVTGALGGGEPKAGASATKSAALAPRSGPEASTEGGAADPADPLRRLEGRWKGTTSQGGGIEWIISTDGSYQSAIVQSGRTVRHAGKIWLDGDGSIRWKTETGQEGMLVPDEEAQPAVFRGTVTGTEVSFEAMRVQP